MNDQEKKTARDFADELRKEVVGVKFQSHRFGKSRTLSEKQREELATQFEADVDSCTASKKLYPGNQPEIQRIGSVLDEAYELWRRYTTFVPGDAKGRLAEKGLRAIKLDLLPQFESEMDGMQAELDAACAEATEHRDRIMAEAKKKLGEQLFNPNDYPTDFRKHVGFGWTTVNFEPNEDLLRLAPVTYAREQERVAKMFEGVAEAFEVETKEKLVELADALLAKLNPEDGKKVKYTEASITKLREFFDRFQMLNIRCDEDLTQLVEQAKEAIGNKTMNQLKKSPAQRKQIAEKFEAIKSAADKLVIEAPSRDIDFDALDED